MSPRSHGLATSAPGDSRKTLFVLTRVCNSLECYHGSSQLATIEWKPSGVNLAANRPQVEADHRRLSMWPRATATRHANIFAKMSISGKISGLGFDGRAKIHGDIIVYLRAPY